MLLWSTDTHGRCAQAKSAEAQRVLAVLDDLVVVQVLSPLQRAVLVVESVPAAPDTLALVDAIAGMPGAPQPAASACRLELRCRHGCSRNFSSQASSRTTQLTTFGV